VRLLIVLPGALGDVVRGLPLLGRLRRALPEATLGWVVEPLSAPVLDGHPWLDRLHRFERRRGISGFVGVARELRRAGYDVALDLGRSAKSGLLTLASRAPRRIGFDRADGREGGWLAATEHLAPQSVDRSKLEQFLAFGERLGVTDERRDFGLRPDVAASERLVGDLGAPLVAACVGSSCPSRRWWPERTAAVLDRLHARHGTTGVLLGTAADAEFGRAVRTAATSPVRDLVAATSIVELVAVLARSHVVFGPDSGALHLAAALGRPVVSLWGATSAARSAPLGSEALVVTGRAACSPCFLARCPIGRVCMEDIAVDAVARGAEGALAA
jgi:lipopolysaccharide heptosyltransferase II